MILQAIRIIGGDFTVVLDSLSYSSSVSLASSKRSTSVGAIILATEPFAISIIRLTISSFAWSVARRAVCSLLPLNEVITSAVLILGKLKFWTLYVMNTVQL